MSKAVRFTVGLAAAATLLAGCGNTGNIAGGGGGDRYKLGAMFALTGPSASIGQDFRKGVEMAVKEINDAGGIKGAKIDLRLEDGKGTAEGGVAAMNKFANLDKTPYVITSTSAQSLAAQPIAAQRKTVLVNVGGSSPDLLNLPFLYNDAVNINAMGPALADHLYQKGYRKLAFIGTADPFGEGSVNTMTPTWKKLGGTVVENQSVKASDTDYSAQLLKVRQAGPDIVIATAIGQTLGQIVQQAKAAGINAPMAGPLATAGLTSVGGKAAEGFEDISMSVVDPTKAPGTNAAKFATAFKAQYNEDPSWIPGAGYEAVYLYKALVENALAQGKNARDGAVLQNLIQNATFPDYMLGGSEVKFLPDHSVGRAVTLREVKDGKFVVTQTIQAGQK
ncbi:ABC transporter substrate-binding protein [Micromonospora inositola]|uniref:Amino acid/amide ABC transporter substrate-binding protein, HAAT family n=1 Tax=Micromonospora inositola TaxID=47865 RepID=A0A1C5K5F6_9ACTN|nr:ABC transporter substrate-binding protein [Micromonospora inositola]SCG78032.1 amino acid/amide ABC transporter substrate-binding protein, HAAT family [Micromonospora inositola]